jgi:hypothetical protein
MGEFSRELFEVAHLFSRAAAPQVSHFPKVYLHFLGLLTSILQAGILSGDNPVAYNAKDPFRLWVIQVGMSSLSFGV